MIDNITSLSGKGLKDWFIQRFTAVYFAVYVLFLFGFILRHSPLHFADWQALFACKGFKIASLLALFALLLHSWVGIWTVTTDYLKCTVLRIGVQLLVLLGLSYQFIWGIMIVWGR